MVLVVIYVSLHLCNPRALQPPPRDLLNSRIIGETQRSFPPLSGGLPVAKIALFIRAESRSARQTDNESIVLVTLRRTGGADTTADCQ